MNKLTLFVLLLGVSTAALSSSENCKHSGERTASADTAGITKIVIGAGAGDLEISGADQAGLRVTGRACASSEKLLGQILLESRRDGDTLYLKTVMPDYPEGVSFMRYATLDLEVSLPKSLALSVEDSSGDLQLHDVRSAVVADSSGDLQVRNIASDLEVTDSSGDIFIGQVGGKLVLKDSSGDIMLENLRADVEITTDSSGDLDIERVGGSIHILNDSSGDIEIAEVQRDVTIQADSSGSIRVDRIGGNFTVHADSGGGIEHQHVLGTVDIPPQD